MACLQSDINASDECWVLVDAQEDRANTRSRSCVQCDPLRDVSVRCQCNQIIDIEVESSSEVAKARMRALMKMSCGWCYVVQRYKARDEEARSR